MTVYREILCQSACNEVHSRFLPYRWDLNCYRGCTHGCRYCFAMYSHAYLASDAFFGEVFVKTNLPDRLERFLRRPSWSREVINLGGITDNYQHAEAKYRLMPEILKLLIRYRTPCILSSKSDLILRDFELIDQLSRLTYVNIAQTVTTMDESVRARLEPGGAPSARRMAVLRAFAGTNASVGVHLMPMIPHLTDSAASLEAVYAAAKEAGAQYVLANPLNLRGRTRTAFFRFLRADFPGLEPELRALYAQGGLDKTYRAGMARRVAALQQQYGLSANYMRFAREKMPPAEDFQQLSLF